MNPWERGWEEEVRLLTKGKEGDGAKESQRFPGESIWRQPLPRTSGTEESKEGARRFVCACAHTHTHTHTHTRTCALTHTRTCALTHMHTCTGTHIHKYAYASTHVHTCMNVCTCLYMCADTCVHAHVFTCVDACSHMHVLSHMLAIHMCACVHTHVHISCVHVHMVRTYRHTCTHVCICCTHIHTCTRIHAHTYADILTHKHTHIGTCTHTPVHSCYTHFHTHKHINTRPGPQSLHTLQTLPHTRAPFPLPLACLRPSARSPATIGIPTRGGLRKPLKPGQLVKGKIIASTPRFISTPSSQTHLQK